MLRRTNKTFEQDFFSENNAKQKVIKFFFSECWWIYEAAATLLLMVKERFCFQEIAFKKHTRLSEKKKLIIIMERSNTKVLRLHGMKKKQEIPCTTW
jgi:hypothetical protein